MSKVMYRVVGEAGADYRIRDNAGVVEISYDGGTTWLTATELSILDGVTSTAAELNILDGVTATASEINQACDESANVEVVTTTNVITASESGKTFFLNAATGFVSTLPAPAAGLRFRFVCGATAVTSGNHTVVTNANATIIYGSSSTAADGTAVGTGSAEDTISFVASTALPGDWVDVISDGTNWYAHGQSAVAAAITMTDAA